MPRGPIREPLPNPRNESSQVGAAYRLLFSTDSKATLETVRRSHSDAFDNSRPGDATTAPEAEDRFIRLVDETLVETNTLRNFLASAHRKIEVDLVKRGRVPTQLQGPDGRLISEGEYVLRTGRLILTAAFLYNQEFRHDFFVNRRNPQRLAQAIDRQLAQEIEDLHNRPNPETAIGTGRITREQAANIRFDGSHDTQLAAVISHVVARSLSVDPPERLERNVQIVLRELSRTDNEGTFDENRGRNEALIEGKLHKKKPKLRKNILIGWESTARLSRQNTEHTNVLVKTLRGVFDQLVIRPGEFYSDRMIDIATIYGFAKTASLINSLLYLTNTPHGQRRERILDVFARWGIATGAAFMAQRELNYQHKEAMRTGETMWYQIFGEEIGLNAILGSTAKILKDRVPFDEFGRWGFNIWATKKTVRFTEAEGIKVINRIPRDRFAVVMAESVQQAGRTMADFADQIDQHATQVEVLSQIADAILPEGGEFGGLRKKLLGRAISEAFGAIDRLTGLADSVSDLAEIPDVLGRIAATMAAVMRQELAGRQVGGTLLQRAAAFLRVYRASGSASTVDWDDIARYFTRTVATPPAPTAPPAGPVTPTAAPTTTGPAITPTPIPTTAPAGAPDETALIQRFVTAIQAQGPRNREDAMRIIADAGTAIPAELHGRILEQLGYALEPATSITSEMLSEPNIVARLRDFRDRVGLTIANARAYLEQIGITGPNDQQRILRSAGFPAPLAA